MDPERNLITTGPDDKRGHTREGWEIGAFYDDGIKADGAKGVLAGYASKFWVVDAYGEFTVPGCFARTIADRGPQGSDRVLYRYEHEVTVGKPTVLREDDSGLYIEARVSDDGMDGTRLRRQLADGVSYGQSIGFRRVGFRSATEDDPLIFDFAPAWALQRPRNELIGLTEVKLPEVSAVSFPAVDNAIVESFRAERSIAFLSSTLDDLRAGTLDERRRALVAELVAAWPADRTPDPDETSAAPPAPSDSLRRQMLDLQFALIDTLGHAA